jgi:D-alanyl-lipoteichoic acid acyltransferase DltB (MBOAT superfamily)
MIFNSISFVIFYLFFFFLYWVIFKNNLKFQNLLLLAGSYVFYGWADWRFLSLLIAVSALNFYLGIAIEKATNLKYKRLLLYIGIIQGIGGLAYFKYFNFFIVSFNAFLQSLSIHLSFQTLHIIVPLGISFFTFRTLSYLLDIDKGKIKPTKDWVVFFNYVSFFPSLLSGPIDKAITFIPQLEKKRVFEYDEAKDGLRQILWGLFKKVVIADNCAPVTSALFDNYHALPASSLLLGAFLYSIQVYADFSGYSDMAIGFARIIGFNVTRNFNFPYFAQNIAEFWRKWHMSLTSWVTEYVFTPLSISFRNYGNAGLILAILINLTIVGIWHGAKWTNVLYGFIHGCYFIPLILRGTMNKTKKTAIDKLLPSFREFINMLGTFSLVMLTFILFKSDTIGQAIQYYSSFFSLTLFSIPVIPSENLNTAITTLVFIFIMILMEWFGREQQYAIARMGFTWPKAARWAVYYAIVLAVFYFTGNAQQFIYFQF